jgi:hypothetical protein
MDDEPSFAEDDESDNGDGDDCDVPTDILMEFFLSGGQSVPDGYALDEDGNLCIDTAAEKYGEELDDSESESEDLSEGAEKLEVEIEYGRGKRRRIANKSYSSAKFWKH